MVLFKNVILFTSLQAVLLRLDGCLEPDRGHLVQTEGKMLFICSEMPFLSLLPSLGSGLTRKHLSKLFCRDVALVGDSPVAQGPLISPCPRPPAPL